MFKGTCNVPILSNEKILQRKESKVLGILINEELSFDKHLSNCKNSPQQKWNQIKLFIYKGLNASTWAMIAQWNKEPAIIREIPSSTQYTDTTTNNDGQRTSMLTRHCISKIYTQLTVYHHVHKVSLKPSRTLQQGLLLGLRPTNFEKWQYWKLLRNGLKSF